MDSEGDTGVGLRAAGVHLLLPLHGHLIHVPLLVLGCVVHLLPLRLVVRYVQLETVKRPGNEDDAAETKRTAGTVNGSLKLLSSELGSLG